MDGMDHIQAIKPVLLAAGFAGLSVLYFIGTIIYRLYFDPLSRIPGPWINAVSRIPFARHLYYGTTTDNVLKLHEKYGEAVRLSPDEVSFISGETAWQDIYGFRTGKHRGELNMPKSRFWYPPAAAGGTHIINGDDEEHSRYRRAFAHAFSEKALANQEEIIQGYVDLLMLRLKENAQTVQNMSTWFNWTTFDVIADLTFGESWGCLRDMNNKYIPIIYSSVRSFRIWYLNRHWPILKKLGSLLVDQSDIKGRQEFGEWIKARTTTRVETDTQRPDFMTEVLKHNGEKGAPLTTHEISNNNGVMMGAGSETTATLLAGVTWLLLKNPQVMQKLKDELRGRWQKYDDITISDVHHTPYLLAVLQEALRYFPPAPTGFERSVPKGGAVVSGYYLPEGTGVGVSSLALGRSELYFHDASSFIPERWLGNDSRFDNDKRDIVQPFNFGPRNCLGKNLAYAEMRIILAKLIWSFDLELDPRSENWISECKCMTVWIRPPLWVKLTEVVRD